MEKKSNRGGLRPNSGRKPLEGSRHTYTVPDDVHEFIMSHGAGECITKLIRQYHYQYFLSEQPVKTKK